MPDADPLMWRWLPLAFSFVHASPAEYYDLAQEDRSEHANSIRTADVDWPQRIAAADRPFAVQVGLRMLAPEARALVCRLSEALDATEVLYSLALPDEVPPEAWGCLSRLRPEALFVSDSRTLERVLDHPPMRDHLRALAGDFDEATIRRLRAAARLHTLVCLSSSAEATGALGQLEIHALTLGDGDGDLGFLAELSDLRRLEALPDRYIDAALLAPLSALEELNLWRTSVGNPEALSRLSSLEVLNLREAELEGDVLPSGLAALRWLDLWGVIVDDLRPLRDMRRLEHLVLSGVIGNSSPLADLPRADSLRYLDVSDLDLESLEGLSGLGSLEVLILRDSALDDGDLEALSTSTNLEHLDLSRAGALDGTGLTHLRALARLRTVHLEGLHLSAAGLSALASLEALDLQRLSLAEVEFPPGALAPLRARSDLEHLDLTSATVRDADLVDLAAMTQLRSLSLQNTPVTDAGLEHLSALTGLRNLHVGFTGVTDTGLRRLAPLTQLRTLVLDGLAITDAGLAALVVLSALEELSLRATAIGDAGVAQLRALPRLTTLDIDGTPVTRGALPALSTFPRLEEVRGGTQFRHGDREFQSALSSMFIETLNYQLRQRRQPHLSPF